MKSTSTESLSLQETNVSDVFRFRRPGRRIAAGLSPGERELLIEQDATASGDDSKVCHCGDNETDNDFLSLLAGVEVNLTFKDASKTNKFPEGLKDDIRELVDSVQQIAGGLLNGTDQQVYPSREIEIFVYNNNKDINVGEHNSSVSQIDARELNRFPEAGFGSRTSVMAHEIVEAYIEQFWRSITNAPSGDDKALDDQAHILAGPVVS